MDKILVLRSREMTDNSFLHTFVSFYLKRNIKDMLAREDEEARHI